jgi:hypothetical protein
MPGNAGADALVDFGRDRFVGEERGGFIVGVQLVHGVTEQGDVGAVHVKCL